MKRFAGSKRPQLGLLMNLSIACAMMSVTSCDKVVDLKDKAMGALDQVKEKSGLSLASVDEKEGLEIINEEARLVVVEFYTDSCGPCKAIAPTLERLAESNAEQVRIIKVDANDERAWATREKIRAVPTFQFYRGGKKLAQFSGAPSEAELQKKIDVCVASSEGSNAQSLVNEGSSGSADSSGTVQPVIQRMPDDWLPAGVTRE
ncbi:thioredoxin family protein [Verrucomicrobiaceae bacterium R5-34]|uniref:Thioredoxin family protein n=1 Tax=Oceaniferula flava TaxID=2800421 RepID=A0AAE2S9R8_9BACT|nr:thioredoxin family protein [Oceaniferula flavus]MBK1829222.1 thioredoxin family protein [Verrucomicrobiaceae bacterium R5-34]MBK1853459.1 thioredoxin family protein [Oceaniferula flavus]MBM1134764.1 thioredoxin family protein [Oceaniferula flavus]